MSAGWDPGAGDKPRPPPNPTVMSAYTPGVLDLRWDDPSILGGNSVYTIVGVNIYRSDVSDRGPFYRINDLPIGGGFYRDRTENVLISREVVNWDTGWVFKGDGPNDRRWVFRTKFPIVKQDSNAPYQRPTPANSPIDVTVYVDDVEVAVHFVFGSSGEVTLVDQPTFNVITEKLEPPPQITESSIVEITYWTNKNHVRSGLDANMHYRLTTVALSDTDPSGYVETDLGNCEPVTTASVERMDYIWREAVRRNGWILQQGGERVKIFIRRQSGIPCTCRMDPMSLAYNQQPSNRCELCLPPGTEITLADFTRKPIEEIRVGDEVLTHTGKVQRVYDTMRREVQENLVEIKATHGVGVSPTGNHPVLIVRRADVRCRRFKTTGVCTGPYSKRVCSRKPWLEPCDYTPQDKLQWVRADEVQVGDYLVFSIPQGETPVEMSRDRLRVLGYYAAEGWTAKKKRRDGSHTASDKNTWFGFHTAEIPTFVQELQGSLQSGYGAASSVQPCSNSSNGCSLAVSKKSVAQDMLFHVGKYSQYKKLSRELVWQGAPAGKEFLGAYFNGDGWQCLNNSCTTLGVSTASYDRARQVEVMLLKQGVVPRFSVRHRTGLSNPGRAGVHETTAHTVAVRKTDMHVLSGTMQKMQDVGSSQRKAGWAINAGSLVLYPVRSIRQVPYTGWVHNLEVEEDHSYVANGVAVHNCYGTGFLGGYEGPFSSIIAPDDAERRISQSPQGRRKEHTYEVFMGPTPVVTMRDFVVKQGNERYSIGAVRRPSNRGNLLQQHFNIAYFAESDIRYKVPIDGTSDLPYPQTRYSIRNYPSLSVDGEGLTPPSTVQATEPYPVGPDAQTPMGTDKDGWAPGTEQRGRTPAFENQTEAILIILLPLVGEVLHAISRGM